MSNKRLVYGIHLILRIGVKSLKASTLTKVDITLLTNVHSLFIFSVACTTLSFATDYTSVTLTGLVGKMLSK